MKQGTMVIHENIQFCARVIDMQTPWLKALLTATALAAVGSAARAEDAGIDWSGAYAGLSLAANRSDIATTDVNGLFGGAFAIQDISASGASTGGLLGYSVQRGSMVYGIELAFASGGASGSSFVDTLRFDETLQWDVNRTLALSARVGTLRGKTLFFASLGVSRADVNYGFLNTDDAGEIIEQDVRTDDTFNGYVIGLGAEHALTARTHLRAEILHSDYSTQTLDVIPGAPVDYDPSNTGLRASVLFRF